jgi:hypothetical protein
MRPDPLPLPKGFSREIQLDRLIIRRTWRQNWLLFVGFTLVWNACTIGWFVKTEINWSALTMNELFPLLSVGIGLFLAYAVIGAGLNTTTLEITRDNLRVSTGPVPWHPEKRIPTAGISNVIFRERTNPRYSSTYRVMVVLGSEKEKSLFGALHSYEETVFYVREIRSWLKLPDVSLSPDA